jgi:hypothetical protein
MKKITFFTLALVLLLSFRVYALKEGTHKAINQYIAVNNINGFSLDTYIRNQLGFSIGVKQDVIGKKVFEWLGYGGVQEDRPGSIFDYVLNNENRSVNHFHNPLKIWDEAGLNDSLFVPVFVPYPPFIQWQIRWYTGQSSILWSQNINQSLGGKWSWQDGREYFYIALTGRDFSGTAVALNQADRERYFAYTFRSVGQLLHLVQDASVPEHVRNDAHAFPAYEAAVEGFMDQTTYGSFWNDLLATPITFDRSILDIPPANPSAPGRISRLIDTDLYNGINPGVTVTQYNSPQTIGLAEYTNANFLSKDTMFKSDALHNFSYPSVTDTTLWIDNNNKKYIKKVGSGDVVNHLAVRGWLDQYRQTYFPQYTENLPLTLDEECYKEYAQKLIPRAVGYSVGLLNYFFRGVIEITLPDNGVYAITTPSGAFKEIHLMAENVTSADEAMPNGTIQLVVKYKLAQQDPFQSMPVPVSADFSYIVVPEKNNASSIPQNSTAELVFDLSNNPIPLWATDVYLQVVYRGQLGNEADAVAVGFKDISEPTPIDIINNMDHICIQGSYLVAGSDAAINAVDTDATIGNNNGSADEWDIFAHSLVNDFLAFSPAQTPTPASSATYNASFASIPPGGYGRVFILTEYDFNLSNNATVRNTDPRDTGTSYTQTTTYPARGLKNQTDIVNEVQIITYPIMPKERGLKWWSGINYVNRAYPLGSVCTTADAQPNLTGPAEATIR